jgi:1-phosphofructokinase
VLEISHEELLAEGRAESDHPDALVAAMRSLAAEGAAKVVVSRSDGPTLAFTDGRVLEVEAPRLQAVQPRGAGDSMTAGLAAGLATGAPFEDARRLGTAAGALNVTRRVLATGQRTTVQRLAELVEVRDRP